MAVFSRHPATSNTAKEARLDGIYVIRTSLASGQFGAQEAVQAYKDLSRVERAFRCLKTDGLEVRPIRHWTPERVRAHFPTEAESASSR